ncbi:MAG: hypothetical protein ACTTJ6_08405 [Treponema sp.]
MKKNLIILLFCLVAVFRACAEDGWLSPIEQVLGEHHETISCYHEQDGYALVLGKKLHYWLYNTYEWHHGDGTYIIDTILPKWVEKLGYVIDFDNIRHVSPNTALASSVKALMKQRGCDISVTFWQDKSGDTLIVNSYDAENKTYWSIFYPLMR